MKNKIAKILGVVLTLATLTSLFVFAGPVSAAITPQAWNKISLPSTTNNVLGTATVLGPMAQSKDGSVIFMSAGMGGFYANGNGTAAQNTANAQALYKSIDFGRTWTAIPAFPNNPDYTTYSPFLGTGQIFDIAFGSDANTVYVTDGINIFKTINGGTSWTTIAGLFNSTLVTPLGWITSLSIGYLGTAPYIFATTTTFGSGSSGGAFVCSEAVYGSPWADMNVGTDRPENTSTHLDCLRITVLPDFSTTQGVMILWSDYSNNRTRLSVKFAGAQWDSTANDVQLEFTTSGGTVLNNFNTPLLSGNIFLPSDFSSNAATGLMQAYVGIDSFDNSANGPDDVYLAYFGPAAANLAYTETPAFDLNVSGTDTASHISCLSGVGTAAGASVLASGFLASAQAVPVVWATKNGGQTWTNTTSTLNAKRPTGGASPLPTPSANTRALSVCQLSYTAAGGTWNGQALVATHGPDNAVSFTKDFGVTFNSITFVNSVINSLVNISLATDNTIYATTQDLVLPNDGNYSVWRMDAVGWERILSYSLLPGTPDFDFVSTVPDNSAVFVTDISTGTIYRSLDKGQTWRAQLSLNPSGGFTSWLVVNASTLLIGAGGGNIYQTTTNGVVWFTRVAFSTGGTVTDIRVASNGDYLAADVNAGVVRVAKSTDGGLNWTAFTSTFTAAGATAAYITPAADYATSGRVYLGTAGATLGIYYATATSTSWTQADGTPGTPVSTVAEVQNTNTTGIVATAGGPGNSSEGTGMIYATNSVGGAGVIRIKGSAKFGEPTFAPSSTTFTGLWLGANSVGNVALYTIAQTGSKMGVYTYPETMNQAGTGVAISAITAGSATVSWTAMTNATAYFVVVSPTALSGNIYATALPTGAFSKIVADGPPPSTSASFTSLASTTSYLVYVWALAPVSSFQFGGASTFTTLPTMPIPVTAGLIPYPGQQNVQPLVNFQWQTVSNATSYELWLDTKVDFSTAQKYSVPAPAGGALNVDWAPPAALAYNTLYYWEVRAVTASGVSIWNGVWSFTTMAAPIPPVTVSVAPVPTIIFPTQQPPVTITQQAPAPVPTITIPLTVTQLPAPPVATPTYIWVIVGVGGILVIAVIILIIRTRRVV